MSYPKLFVGLLLTFETALATSQTHQALAAPAVPLRASGPEWVRQEAPHPDCGPGRLKVEVEGTGQASHLGRYTVVRQHCFNLATFTIEDGRFVASPTQITGGTGRFAHASGAGNTCGVFNVVRRLGTFTFEGEIANWAAHSASQ